VNGVAQRGDRQADQGAAAVEFALVSVLLFTILFGILQYGFGFFQMQAVAATTQEAARLAAVGLYPKGAIDGCTNFGNAVATRGEDNGLPAASVKTVKVNWSDSLGNNLAERGGTATIQVVVEPTDFHYPFVPFPDTITRTLTITVENVGTVTGPCTANPNP